jgi:hypothetical protein
LATFGTAEASTTPTKAGSFATMLDNQTGVGFFTFYPPA